MRFLLAALVAGVAGMAGAAWLYDGAAPVSDFETGGIAPEVVDASARAWVISALAQITAATSRVAALENARRPYPVLRLELGGAWCDFELKASTDNFASLVYYYISTATNAVADDPDPLVYFSDDYSADPRAWRKQAPVHAALLHQFTNGLSVCDTVYVWPSTNTAVASWRWMQETNNKLVWAYVRFAGAAAETNAAGGQRWNLVRPERWESQRSVP